MSTKRIFGIFSIVVITAISTYLLSFYFTPDTKHKDQVSTSASFDVMEINGAKDKSPFPLYGITTYVITHEVQLKVNGTIDQNNRSLNVGQKVKKDEVLIKVDRLAILYEILEKRTAFKKLIIDVLPKLEEKTPSEKDKWETYAQRIQRTSFIPALPEISLEEEAKLLDQSSLLATYYNLKKIELEAENYFYTAPFDGLIISSKVAPGSMINKNIPLLVLAKKGSMVVKSSLPIEEAIHLSSDEAYFFINPEKDTVGMGYFVSNAPLLSDSSTVISTFNIQSESDLLAGKRLEITPLEKPSPQQFTIPKSAVREQKVLIYVGAEIVSLPIQIISETADSVVVEGFQGPCLLITNPK